MSEGNQYTPDSLRLNCQKVGLSTLKQLSLHKASGALFATAAVTGLGESIGVTLAGQRGEWVQLGECPCMKWHFLRHRDFASISVRFLFSFSGFLFVLATLAMHRDDFKLCT